MSHENCMKAEVERIVEKLGGYIAENAPLLPRNGASCGNDWFSPPSSYDYVI